jgi:hypothetical protein
MTQKFKEPKWDTMYVKMLDAIIEYMDNDIAPRGDDNINERDIRIIRALVEFYDFEIQDNSDLAEIMEDVAVRADQLEEEELKQNGSH